MVAQYGHSIPSICTVTLCSHSIRSLYTVPLCPTAPDTVALYCPSICALYTITLYAVTPCRHSVQSLEAASLCSHSIWSLCTVVLHSLYTITLSVVPPYPAAPGLCAAPLYCHSKRSLDKVTLFGNSIPIPSFYTVALYNHCRWSLHLVLPFLYGHSIWLLKTATLYGHGMRVILQFLSPSCCPGH